MKKNLSALFIFMTIGFAAAAQTEKGNYLVGGNLELNTAKNNTVITVAPSAGYFIISNLAIGANIDLGYSRNKAADTRTTALGIGPFARYYLGTLNIRPFGQANFNFSSEKTKVRSSSTTENGTDFFIGAGLAAFINRNVAVEGLAGYNRVNYNNSSGSGGFNLRIGFQVYLSREQVASVKSGL